MSDRNIVLLRLLNAVVTTHGPIQIHFTECLTGPSLKYEVCGRKTRFPIFIHPH